MKKTIKFFRNMALIIGIAGLVSTANAWPRYGYGGYHSYHSYHSVRVYHYGGYHSGFVPGVVAGAIIGGAVYNATHPVYAAPIPSVVPATGWVIVDRQVFDPSCNCYVTVRQYQDSYGYFHPYP